MTKADKRQNDALDALETRVAALEARPTDPEISARVAAIEAELNKLRSFDQKVREL